MKKTIDKLKTLNDFLLNSKYHLGLEDILKEDKSKIENILSGKEKPSEEILKEIADFFYLDYEILEDDNLELPNNDHIQVDDVKVSAIQSSYLNKLGKKKHKHVIKRNYDILDKPTKKKLFINLACIFIPVLVFVIYCITSVSINRVETINTYKQGDKLSSSQQVIESCLPKQGELGVTPFANIRVGSTIENIKNISTSNNNYSVTMSVRFDFDQIEFHKMFYYKNKGITLDKSIDYSFYDEKDYLVDNYCPSSTSDSNSKCYLPYSDNIPDIFQFNFESNKHLYENNVKPISINTLYEEETKSFPGEKSSNIYTSKNDEFCIGNGKIDSDSLEYLEKGKPYYDEQTKSFRYTQSAHFSATINKKFDSPRYPLDSAQFHIYIQPTLNSKYIRYIADKEMSGYSTYFSISDGYRLINETNDIKNLSIKLNYYTEKDLDRSSSTFGQNIIKTQFEIVVRANKTGFSVFINSFLNIIAVAIWLILAFFNQSFNKEDSISMIGTGFFSAISAILLGLSLVSSGNIFSLLTVVNIFTLCMVLIMGYESITAKRINKMGDAVTVAYKTVKVRILFYFLVICSIIMYIVLPAISYLWML